MLLRDDESQGKNVDVEDGGVDKLGLGTPRVECWKVGVAKVEIATPGVGCGRVEKLVVGSLGGSVARVVDVGALVVGT